MNLIGHMMFGRLIDCQLKWAPRSYGKRDEQLNFGSDKPTETVRSSRLSARVLIFFLLFTVAGLATMAKNGQYFPRTNPARHASLSTKMNVTHAPVISDGHQWTAVERISLPQPPLGSVRVEEAPGPSVSPIGVTVSMQLRSPPAPLS